MSANNSRQEILDVVYQLCGIGAAESVQPSSGLEEAMAADIASPPPTNEMLQKLNIHLNEGVDEASEAHESMQQWKSLMPQNVLLSVRQKVTNGLQIPKTTHIGMNPEMNSRLHILIQLASYIRFLKSQENDAAYGNQRSQIKEALFKIIQMGRVLRQLLPLSDEDIKNYIIKGISDRVLVLDKCQSAVKRAVCCVAIEMILDTLTNIHVSVSSKSVTIG